MIKLYSAEWCGACKQVKMVLNSESIPYEVIDIDENPEVVKEKQFRSIPVIEREDGNTIVGFRPSDRAALIEFCREQL